jgi:hypothetical protein
VSQTRLAASSPVDAKHDLAATVAERRDTGRQARVLAPRAAIGEWGEGARGHDALETLMAQDAIRLPELLPLRYRRVAFSPWNYYRGAAAVMAADLASRPHSRLEVQLCGDAHVLNFGLWATPERNLNFDLRDFDETLPGPFEWDVARLAASLVVAAQQNSLKPARADAAVTAAVDAYRRRMRRYATLPLLDIWYEGTDEPRRVRQVDLGAAWTATYHAATSAARDARGRRTGRHRRSPHRRLSSHAPRGPPETVRPLPPR